MNRLVALGAAPAGAIARANVHRLIGVLGWHPTEATTLVAAGAIGVEGAVDMRRGRAPVELDHASAELWVVDDPARLDLHLAKAVIDTNDLEQAEQVMRDVAVDELDFERHRARAIQHEPAMKHVPLAVFIEQRRAAGATHITTRRLHEAQPGWGPSQSPAARVGGLGLWSLDALASSTPAR